MNDETTARAVLELSNARMILEQLDVKSSRANMTNVFAVSNSISMAIKMLTEPEKGADNGTSSQMGK